MLIFSQKNTSSLSDISSVGFDFSGSCVRRLKPWNIFFVNLKYLLKQWLSFSFSRWRQSYRVGHRWALQHFLLPLISSRLIKPFCIIYFVLLFYFPHCCSPPSTAKSISVPGREHTLQLDCKGEGTAEGSGPGGGVSLGRASKPRPSIISSGGFHTSECHVSLNTINLCCWTLLRDQVRFQIKLPVCEMLGLGRVWAFGVWPGRLGYAGEKAF